ncbi:MAG: hypothetical protein ACHP6I_00715 [Rickettsiales bacterium]
MRHSLCHDIITFPFDEQNYFFGAHLIHIAPSYNNDLNSYLERTISQRGILEQAVASFSSMDSATLRAKHPSVFYLLNTNDVVDPETLTTSLLQNFALNSLADQFARFMILGALHRLTQIASLSAKNKINSMDINPTMKFICASAISTLAPFAVMQYLGYPAAELFIASCLQQTASYLLAPVISGAYNLVSSKTLSSATKKSIRQWASSWREIDLISDHQKLNTANLLKKNALSFFRYLSATAFTDILLSPPMGSEVIRHKASLGICADKGSLHVFGFGVNTLSFTLVGKLTVEAGWSFGRLLVDLTFALLNKLSSLIGFSYFADLKDPFHSNVNPPASEPLLRTPPAASTTAADASASYFIPDVKTKRKKVEHIAYQEEKNPEKTKQNNEYNQHRFIITNPNYEDQKLYPLRFNGNTARPSVFGVISDTKSAHFDKFTTCLSKADIIAPNGWVESLAAERTYCIRNKGNNERMVGAIYTGHDAVYEQLKKIYDSYENALAATRSIEAFSSAEARVVIFSRTTTHEQLATTANNLSASL